MTGRTVRGPGLPPASAGPVPHLSANELAVLQGSSLGATYGQLARQLGITEKAVGNIAMRVVRKLGAHNITHAVYVACQLGVLDVRAPNNKVSEVHAEPTLRLVRSLIAEGFSISFIADRMAMGQPELSVLMGRVFVTPAMAERVRLVFAELAGRDPLEAGVHPRGVTRARNRGRVEGWEILPPPNTATQHAA